MASPPTKVDLPALDAGDRGHADICVRERGVSHALKAGRHRHDADLALWEITGPGRSGLGLGIGHQRGAVLDQAAEDRVDAFVLSAVEVRFGAFRVHDRLAVGPGDRPPGEHFAATAVAAEEGAVDIAAELLDCAGVSRELRQRSRAACRDRGRLP